MAILDMTGTVSVSLRKTVSATHFVPATILKTAEGHWPMQCIVQQVNSFNYSQVDDGRIDERIVHKCCQLVHTNVIFEKSSCFLAKWKRKSMLLCS